jgi:guanylate kinase
VNRIVILAAPSGAGKTTIMARLIASMPEKLSFSVSATTRPIRSGEVDGKDYFFITVDEFQQKIEQDGFVEWEMVYEGIYYGTTKDELQRIWGMGKTPLLDIDVYGAMKVKHQYGDQVISIFIEPPSIEALRERLTKRGTDSAEAINKRVAKASEEIAQKKHFDHIVMNDNLEKVTDEVLGLVREFLIEG